MRWLLVGFEDYFALAGEDLTVVECALIRPLAGKFFAESFQFKGLELKELGEIGPEVLFFEEGQIMTFFQAEELEALGQIGGRILPPALGLRPGGPGALGVGPGVKEEGEVQVIEEGFAGAGQELVFEDQCGGSLAERLSLEDAFF